MGTKVSYLVFLVFLASAQAGCPYASQASMEVVEAVPRNDDEVVDPETTTPNGCTCISLCGATVEDGFTVRLLL